MPKRLSHIQFLESLSTHNEHYRKGLFKVTSTRGLNWAEIRYWEPYPYIKRR